MNPDQIQFEKYWRKRIAEETKINNKEIDFYDWVGFGKEMGWCSDIVCETHDGLPMTDEEMEGWEFGSDECVPAIRIW
jgi:hypothetical protein